MKLYDSKGRVIRDVNQKEFGFRPIQEGDAREGDPPRLTKEATWQREKDFKKW